MRDILAEIRRWQSAGKRVALATLVGVERSAPRPAGARCAVSEAGEIVGSVSAGCVESDVVERALQVLDSGEPVRVRYEISDGDAFRVGLTCGGVIDIVIAPLLDTPQWRALADHVERDEAIGLALAVEPEELCGRDLVVVGDRVVGSIGEAVDGGAVAALAEMTGGDVTRTIALGGARVYLERVLPSPKLIVVGATHAAIPLCGMAKILGYRVTVVDPRSAFANEHRLPAADLIVSAWPEEAFEEISLDRHTYLVILTHDEKFDLPTLRRAMRSEVAYIGAMASRRTHAKRTERLLGEGFSGAEIARIHSPVGLDIGGRRPEEIALSILAEVTAVRNGRAAMPLGEGCGPIHDGKPA